MNKVINDNVVIFNDKVWIRSFDDMIDVSEILFSSIVNIDADNSELLIELTDERSDVCFEMISEKESLSVQIELQKSYDIWERLKNAVKVIQGSEIDHMRIEPNYAKQSITIFM